MRVALPLRDLPAELLVGNVAQDAVDVKQGIGKRAGVSPTTVLNLEAGKGEPQRRTIRKLAQALEVDPAELVE
jgi:transcriptional regulator with XRE-family HTH domain